MKDWQGSDPRSTNGMEELDNRRSQVGDTLVYSDRYGPYEFWRGGVQVECICDPRTGMQCKYHGERTHTALPCHGEPMGRDAASAVPVGDGAEKPQDAP